MAIVEFQFREQAFSDLLRHFINARRLPSATIKNPLHPSIENHPLDSITCAGCTLEASDSDGEVTAHLDLLIRYYDSYADARTAGSLQRPATNELHQPLPVTLKVLITQTPQGPKPALLWSVFLNFLPGGQIDLGGLGEFAAQKGAVVLENGILAIRLATNAADSVTSPVINRLIPQSDWTQIVPGEVIGSVLVSSLDAAVAGFADADHVPGEAAVGGYVSTPIPGLPPPPLAVARAEIVAVDACPFFNIDVSVWLQTVATFAATGAVIETTLKLSWDADSFWCDVAGGFILTPIASFVIDDITADKANDAVLGRASTPQGYIEIGRDADSITYQQERILDIPRPLVLTGSQFTSEGLVISGSVQADRSGQGLQGWVDPPVSNLAVDCNARSVSVKFHPASVGLYDYDAPGGPPKLFADWTEFIPPNAWTVVPTHGNSWQDLVLTFVDPPGGRLPVGTATSVFIMTDCGLRWVDLGVIPADHPMPNLADMASMISKCMAKSAGWKERILSVKWLPRPPGDLRGMPPIRQWMFGFQDLHRSVRLQFVAVAENGRERVIGVIEGGHDAAIQLITDADETLEVRSNDSEYNAAPMAAQRWILPFASLPLKEEPVSVAAAAGLLGLRGREGTTTLVAMDANGKLRTQPIGPAGRALNTLDRLSAALSRDERRGRRAWASVAQLDEHTVAVVHNGSIVIGTLGPLQRL